MYPSIRSSGGAKNVSMDYFTGSVDKAVDTLWLCEKECDGHAPIDLTAYFLSICSIFVVPQVIVVFVVIVMFFTHSWL